MNSYHHHQQRLLELEEEKLRDEVIYLHSLWHLGPPTQTPNQRTYLHVSNPIPFKRTNRRNKLRNVATITQLGPGLPWPVDSPPSSPSPSTSSWPAFKGNPTSSSTRASLSEAELADIVNKQMQQGVVKCCGEFFAKMVGLDGVEVVDEEFDDEDEDLLDDDDDHDGDIEEGEEFKFLFGLFVENQELRKFYENNHEVGEFYCLVCGGIGEKLAKKFKGCSSLVQHAVAISKTKRKRAHRAFSRVICRVLGWDFGRLPIIVSKGVTLSQSLVNLSQTLNFSEKKDNDGNENLDKGIPDVRAEEVVASKEGDMECLESESSTVSYAQRSQEKSVVESHLTSLGWPTSEPQATSMKSLISSEEVAKLNMVNLQQKSLEECQKFLSKLSSSDGDKDEEDWGEDEAGDKDDLIDDNRFEECEEIKSFLRLFSENNELRNYYEDQYDSGDFCCLVCGAIGKKVWKRFKGCAELLQHAITLSRTKKNKAHRAYGLAICKVLGWDIDWLPMIVVKGEPLGQSLKSASVFQGEPKENDVCGEEDVNSICANNDDLTLKEDTDNHQNGEPTIHEAKLKVDGSATGKHDISVDSADSDSRHGNINQIGDQCHGDALV